MVQDGPTDIPPRPDWVNPEEWETCVRLTQGPDVPRHLRKYTPEELAEIRALPDDEPDSPEQAEMIRATVRAARDPFAAEMFERAMEARREANEEYLRRRGGVADDNRR